MNTDFYAACRAVFDNCPDTYAKSYARAGLTLSDRHAIHVQALYILNNMQHWRGEEARQVRTILREYAK